MKLKLLLFLLAFATILHPAQRDGIADLTVATNSLCSGMSSLMPVVAMLMTVLGAVIYASGQMMGAETRARTNVWATAALTGAMMAVLISIIAPSVFGAIYGSSFSCLPVITFGDTCGNSNGCICQQTTNLCYPSICKNGQQCQVTGAYQLCRCV